MIKRPVLPLMLLTLASIFLFFLLNLLLGSVHIPLRSVWNILWGNTEESVIWQNIIWKSRVPQALTALVAGAGLSVSGLQMQTVFRNPLAGPSVLGISSGASLGVACVVLLSGADGRCGIEPFGVYGRGCLVGCRHYRCAGCDGAHCLCLPEGEGQRDAADNRCDDRLCGKCRHRRIEIFQCGGGYTCVCHLGIGQLCPCLGRPDGAVCLHHGCAASVVLPADKDDESVAAGRWLCTQSGTEHQAGTPAGYLMLRCAGGYCNGLLRSDYVLSGWRFPICAVPSSTLRTIGC